MLSLRAVHPGFPPSLIRLQSREFARGDDKPSVNKSRLLSLVPQCLSVVPGFFSSLTIKERLNANQADGLLQ